MNQEVEIGKAYAANELKPTDLPGALTKRTKSKAKVSAKTAAERRALAQKESRIKGELFVGGSLEAESKLDSDAYREKMDRISQAPIAPPPDPSIAAARVTQQITDKRNELAAAKERKAAINEKISQKTRERQRALNDINYVDDLGSIEKTLEHLRGPMHYTVSKEVETLTEDLERLEKEAPTISEAEQTRKRWVALETKLLVDEQMRIAEVKAQHARSIQQCNADLERYNVNAKQWQAKTLATGGKAAVVQGKKEISDYWKGKRN